MWGGGLGVDGGLMPLPTCPQRYCDPASPVLDYPHFDCVEIILDSTASTEEVYVLGFAALTAGIRDVEAVDFHAASTASAYAFASASILQFKY